MQASSALSKTPTIDAHQHFWHYCPQEHSWIEPSMQPLKQDLLPEHLEPELASSGIDGVISVQALQTMEETEWLLQLAEQHAWIRGVVGWAPIPSPGFAKDLEQLESRPALKGLRHIVQAEPDPDFLLRKEFAEGIRRIGEAGLVYDLLIVERQLPQGIRFVDQHPNQIFVLDHIAKPKIGLAEREPWQENLRELARRPHVYCKLSGLVTEAAWDCWKPDDLQPYIDATLEAFGPERIMAGSDWPVCTLAVTYGDWIRTLRALLGSLSQDERARIFGGTAIEAYYLDDSTRPHWA